MGGRNRRRPVWGERYESCTSARSLGCRGGLISVEVLEDGGNLGVSDDLLFASILAVSLCTGDALVEAVKSCGRKRQRERSSSPMIGFTKRMPSPTYFVMKAGIDVDLLHVAASDPLFPLAVAVLESGNDVPASC